MGPKNWAKNWPYNRFGHISDCRIAGIYCINTMMCVDMLKECLVMHRLTDKYMLRALVACVQ